MSIQYGMDDRKLISLVRQHAELYDITIRGYNDIRSKENIWTAIAEEMKQPVNRCKFRWNNMRDNFRKVLKRSQKKDSNGRKYKYEKELGFIKPFFHKVNRKVASAAAAGANHEWDGEEEKDYNESDQEFIEYEQSIEYDGPNQNDNVTIKNIKHQISDLETTSDISQTNDDLPCSPQIHDQPNFTEIIFDESNHGEYDGEVELKHHQVDTFLAGIASTMKTFNPYYLNQAKSKIFAVVQEFELAQIVHNENQKSSPKIKITEMPAVSSVYSEKDWKYSPQFSK